MFSFIDGVAEKLVERLFRSFSKHRATTICNNLETACGVSFWAFLAGTMLCFSDRGYATLLVGLMSGATAVLMFGFAMAIDSACEKISIVP